MQAAMAISQDMTSPIAVQRAAEYGEGGVIAVATAGKGGAIVATGI